MKKAYFPAEVKRDDLMALKGLLDDRDHEAAGRQLQTYLKSNYRDLDAWFLMARLMLETDNPPMAWMILSHIVSAGGQDRWQNWCNLGKAFNELHNWADAEKCFNLALKKAPDEQVILENLGTCYVQQYKSDDAIKTLERCISLHPEANWARSSLGYAYLQKRDYKNGWHYYERGYGRQPSRTERKYSSVDEPLWQGETGEDVRLIVHGEQGIGDQIAGVEPLLDVANKVSVVALEVSPKLHNLFQRSFPNIDVYPTLHERGLAWPARVRPNCHAGLFSLHKQVRKQESDYPGKPYLVADPDRVIQWHALLNNLGNRPKIGIAWSGGAPSTQQDSRRIPLEELTPILRQDADFISLEYRDRSEEYANYERRRGIKIHHWNWGTETEDYDDTAALVSCLDLVVTVPTSVVHLAGALGKQCWVMVHESPNIHYTGFGKHIPYYGNTVTMYRRENREWKTAISQVAKDLQRWLNVCSRAA